MITQKELSLKIVKAVDTFFKDSRAYDITIFFWSQKKDGDVLLDLKLTYKISIDNGFVIGSSAYPLIEKKSFTPDYLKCSDNIALSQQIAENLNESEHYQLTQKEFVPNFGIVNGATFHHASWKKNLSDLLGHQYVEEYYTILLYEGLSKSLDEKIEKITRQIKI